MTPGKKGEIHTLSEIIHQFPAWEATIEYVLRKRKSLEEFFARTSEKGVLFTGCGSSYHLASSTAFVWQALTGKECKYLPASEVFLFPESVTEHWKPLVVVFSRSGETTETLRAVELLNQKDLPVLGITCCEKSSLVRSSSLFITTRGIEEKSIVETGSFSAMLLIGQTCAFLASRREDLINETKELPAQSEELFSRGRSNIEKLAKKEFKKAFFLGSGPYYGLACDASLKMKEMALIPSEAFTFLEFRHGPISLVDKNSLMVALFSERSYSYESPVVRKAKDYGAMILALGVKKEEVRECFIPFPSGLSEFNRRILSAPLVQLLACYQALERGLNPDKPPHLKRVVKLKEE